MSQLRVSSAGGALQGRVRVPGDKSISHRAVLFGMLADGDCRVRGFLDGADCRATVACARTLGVEVELVSPTELIVRGRGLDGLKPPAADLDCANSGTTMRLLVGLMAGQAFDSRLVGTPQLSTRPMARVVDPLRTMQAAITTEAGGLAPLVVTSARLTGVEHALRVASAQVKSCLLLAGLYAEGPTTTIEPGPCRDHTERLLQAMGAPLTVDGPRARIERPRAPLSPFDLIVPGDVSSAAFLLVAGAACPGSRITLAGVGVNPTRTGIVSALERLGALIERSNLRDAGGEPVADLTIAAAPLRGATFGGSEIVTMIDELPILAVAATQAEGETVIRDAAELRVKETDRIATTAAGLRAFGAQIEERPDGMTIHGPTRLTGAPVTSAGDHRLAMALTIAGLLATGTTTVDEAEVTGDSFPGFAETLRTLGAQVEERA